MTEKKGEAAKAPPEENVPIGAVIKPHGLAGEVRVHPFNADSPIWAALETVFLDGKTVEVKRCKRAAKHFIVRFAGVDGRNDAEALRGRELSVSRSALPQLDDDEFYLADLVGLQIRAGDETLGEVEAVLEYPSCVCLKVRSDDGVRELPILEPWFERLDLEAGVIFVGAWDDLPVVS